MQTSGNTILITGGATGIGIALAEQFLNNGNEVIVCGRRAGKLEEAKRKFPGIHTKITDISTRKGREELIRWTISTFPKLKWQLIFTGQSIATR